MNGVGGITKVYWEFLEGPSSTLHYSHAQTQDTHRHDPLTSRYVHIYGVGAPQGKEGSEKDEDALVLYSTLKIILSSIFP